MSTPQTKKPRIPPRWFIRAAWVVHRALYRLSGGRFLSTPTERGWGTLHLTTIGRRSGEERAVLLGYVEDGPNLVVVAMNGWGEGQPAWWLNLRARPDATIRLAHQSPRPVRAHVAVGAEHDRLWQLWKRVEPDLDGYAAQRSTPTPVVVLEPR